MIHSVTSAQDQQKRRACEYATARDNVRLPDEIKTSGTGGVSFTSSPTEDEKGPPSW